MRHFEMGHPNSGEDLPPVKDLHISDDPLRLISNLIKPKMGLEIEFPGQKRKRNAHFENMTLRMLCIIVTPKYN